MWLAAQPHGQAAAGAVAAHQSNGAIAWPEMAPVPASSYRVDKDLAIRFEQLQLQADSLEERVLSAGRTVRMVQEYWERADERHENGGSHIEARLKALEQRMEQLEGGRPPIDVPTIRAELQEAIARDIRGELSASVASLNGELTTRFDRLRSWQADFEQDLQQSISEAVQTCSRLADDSLAASEATQQKLEDLRAQLNGTASLDQQTTVHLSAACATSPLERVVPAPLPPARPASGSPTPERGPSPSVPPRRSSSPVRQLLEQAPPVSTAQPSASRSTAEAPTEELGWQIWRLGEALRRVVQVQQEQQKQLQTLPAPPSRSSSTVRRTVSRATSPVRTPPAGSRMPSPDTASAPAPAESSETKGLAAVQRNGMIVALYEELQQLEDGLLTSGSVAPAGSAAKSLPPKRSSSPPRRVRSRQPIRVGDRISEQKRSGSAERRSHSGHRPLLHKPGRCTYCSSH